MSHALKYGPGRLGPRTWLMVVGVLLFSLISLARLAYGQTPAPSPNAAAAALAQQLVANPDAPLQLGPLTTVAIAAYHAFKDGNTVWPVGLTLILVMYVFLRFAKPRMPWFSTKMGGMTATAVVSILGAFGTTFLAVGTGGFSRTLLLHALELAVMSSAVVALAKAFAAEHLPALHDLLWPRPAPTVSPPTLADAVTH